MDLSNVMNLPQGIVRIATDIRSQSERRIVSAKRAESRTLVGSHSFERIDPSKDEGMTSLTLKFQLKIRVSGSFNSVAIFSTSPPIHGNIRLLNTVGSSKKIKRKNSYSKILQKESFLYFEIEQSKNLWLKFYKNHNTYSKMNSSYLWHLLRPVNNTGSY